MNYKSYFYFLGPFFFLWSLNLFLYVKEKKNEKTSVFA